MGHRHFTHREFLQAAAAATLAATDAFPQVVKLNEDVCRAHLVLGTSFF